MGFRTKALGIVSAGILGIGILSGTALADSTTTANFLPNPNGSCSAGADSSTVDFGTYVYDGAHYTTSTTPVINFSVSSTFGPGSGCDVYIESSALVNDDDATATIPVADILLKNISGGTQGTINTPVYIGYNLIVVENGLGNYTSNISFNGLYAGAYELGTYSGTLTFTASLAP